jgi:protein Tob/BTG
MKDEVSAASDFLTRLVGKNENLSEAKVSQFRDRLNEVLLNKFKNHWFPEKPSRGQGFRCIRVNENIRRDPTLDIVCHEVGIKYSDLMLPLELTLWIDPEEVTCRFGEHKGSYCIVAQFKDGNKENYVDQIDIDELEKKSLEQAKQASFDLVNASRRKAKILAKIAASSANNSYGLTNGYGCSDYSNSMTTTASYYSSPMSGYYSSGSKYTTSFSPSIHSQSPSHMFGNNSYSISPPNRGSFRNGFSSSSNTASPGNVVSSPSNASNTGGGKFSRGLSQAFNSASMSSQYNSYQPQGDRFHWNNKSIVKA